MCSFFYAEILAEKIQFTSCPKIVHGTDCKEKNSWIRGKEMFVHGTDYKSTPTSHNK